MKKRTILGTDRGYTPLAKPDKRAALVSRTPGVDFFLKKRCVVGLEVKACRSLPYQLSQVLVLFHITRHAILTHDLQSFGLRQIFVNILEHGT